MAHGTDSAVACRGDDPEAGRARRLFACRLVEGLSLIAAALLWSGCDECENGQYKCEGGTLFECTTSCPDPACAGDHLEWVELYACEDAGASCTEFEDPEAGGTTAACLFDTACPSGAESMCVDSHSTACSPTGAPYAPGEDCGDGLCVDADGEGFCVMSMTPCPEDASSYCDGNRLVTCQSGYPLYDEECYVACRGGDGEAFCVDTSAPCPEGASSFCDGDSRMVCAAGYVTDEDYCPNFDMSCLEIGGGEALCVWTTTPCPEGVEAYCDGDYLITCESGYPTEARDCMTAWYQPCQDSGDGASCEG